MKAFNITVNGQVYEVQVEEVGGAAPVAAPKVAAAPVAAGTGGAPAKPCAPAAPRAAATWP